MENFTYSRHDTSNDSVAKLIYGIYSYYGAPIRERSFPVNRESAGLS